MATIDANAKEISQIKVGNVNYYLKDEAARAAIETLNSFEYIISDTAATTPSGVIWQNGNSVVTGTLTASASTMNKIYLVPDSNGTALDNYAPDYYDEFITIKVDKTYSWESIGNTQLRLGALGALAYLSSASATYTPEGSVSSTFKGTAQTIDMSHDHGVEITDPSFSGTKATISVSGKPTGTVSKPGITVTPSTDTITPVASVGNAADWGATVTNGVLSFTWTPNTPASFATSAKTFMTGASAALNATPTFTGNTNTFTGDYTPSGTVSGTSVTVSTEGISKSITPSGTVTSGFTGTNKTITVS